MTPTSAFCRAQAATQLARAAHEPLENVRKVALAAAKAWNTEAVCAENRENGHIPVPQLRLSSQEQEDDRQYQASLSKNRDRDSAA